MEGVKVNVRAELGRGRGVRYKHLYSRYNILGGLSYLLCPPNRQTRAKAGASLQTLLIFSYLGKP